MPLRKRKKKTRKRSRKKRGKGGVFSKCPGCGKVNREEWRREDEMFSLPSDDEYLSDDDYLSSDEYLPLSPSEEKELIKAQHNKVLKDLRHEMQQRENFKKGMKALIEENDDTDSRTRPVSPRLSEQELRDGRLTPDWNLAFVDIEKKEKEKKEGGTRKRRRRKKRKYKSNKLKR